MGTDKKYRLADILINVTLIIQIIATVMLIKQPASVIWRIFGMICLWIAVILVWLPVVTFKKYGGIGENENYVSTTLFVDQGIYSVVRHPQYLAGIMISIGLTLLAPHWTNLFFGFVNASQFVVAAYQEERDLIGEFGEQYRAYMKRVPRLNIFWGLIKKYFQRPEE